MHTSNRNRAEQPLVSYGNCVTLCSCCVVDPGLRSPSNQSSLASTAVGCSLHLVSINNFGIDVIRILFALGLNRFQSHMKLV